jgi:tetratricopeptide (TPR) repeat protein
MKNSKLVSIIFILSLACKNPSTKSLKKFASQTINIREIMMKSFADSLYEAKNYKKSVKYYDSLTHFDSLDGEYFFRYAYSYAHINDQMASKEETSGYLKAIELGYHLNSAYFNLGITNCYTNDSLALVYLNKCYELDPNKIGLKLIISKCEERIRMKEEAINLSK